MAISVILPVYNNEKTLEKCIQSIRESMYKEYELLLIDDGSADSSSFICKKYVEKDRRIKYFYSRNRGVNGARNFGLQHISNEFVTFIDADDFIEKDHLLNFSIYANHYDLIMQGMRYIDSFGHDLCYLIDGNIVTKHSIVANSREEVNNKIGIIPAFGWVTNKLYRTTIIKDKKILFPDKDIINGDRLFNFLYYLNINSFIILPTITYNYVENKESISHKFIHPKKFIIAAKEYDALIGNNLINKNILEYIALHSIRFYVHAIGNCILAKPSKISSIRRICLIINVFYYLFSSQSFKYYKLKGVLIFFKYVIHYIKRILKIR